MGIDKESIESILDWQDRPRQRSITLAEFLQEDAKSKNFKMPDVLNTKLGQYDSVDLSTLRLTSLYDMMTQGPWTIGKDQTKRLNRTEVILDKDRVDEILRGGKESVGFKINPEDYRCDCGCGDVGE